MCTASDPPAPLLMRSVAVTVLMQAVATEARKAAAAKDRPSSQYELFTLTTWLLRVRNMSGVA